jgi:hypothetical protein
MNETIHPLTSQNKPVILHGRVLLLFFILFQGAAEIRHIKPALTPKEESQAWRFR